MKKNEIEELLFQCIEIYNGYVVPEKQLNKTIKERLFSRSGYTADSKLDSLGLVNFLVITEEKFQEFFNNDFHLDFEKILNNKEKDLQTIETFALFLYNNGLRLYEKY